MNRIPPAAAASAYFERQVMKTHDHIFRGRIRGHELLSIISAARGCTLDRVAHMTLTPLEDMLVWVTENQPVSERVQIFAEILRANRVA
jgi:hypothetical protein